MIFFFVLKRFKSAVYVSVRCLFFRHLLLKTDLPAQEKNLSLKPFRRLSVSFKIHFAGHLT